VTIRAEEKEEGMSKYDLGTCPHGSKPIRCEICHPESADPCPQCALKDARIKELETLYDIEGENRSVLLRSIDPLNARLVLLEKVAVAARKIPNRWSPELEAALRGLNGK
jgi:hypothetical protein